MGMHDSEMISISSLLLLWFPFLFYFLHPFGPTGQGRILGSFFFLSQRWFGFFLFKNSYPIR
jgi:hypothetical protein